MSSHGYASSSSHANHRLGSAAVPRYVTPTGSVSTTSSKAVSFSSSVDSAPVHRTPAPSFHSLASDYPPTYREGSSRRSDGSDYGSDAPSYHTDVPSYRCAGSVQTTHSGYASTHHPVAVSRSSSSIQSAYAASTSPSTTPLAIMPALTGSVPFRLDVPLQAHHLPLKEPAFLPPLHEIDVHVPLITGRTIKFKVPSPGRSSGLTVGDVLNALLNGLHECAKAMMRPTSDEVQAMVWDRMGGPVPPERVRVLHLLPNGYVFAGLVADPRRPRVFFLETRRR
ncbi:hypothetical protein BD626DRAFT_537905 [Schizophyllum amplum]|uniref:DUF6699 domain-containing protein n=1 Tax=Schizophyllum amplum TaxID=97359 RepID=A0A550CAC1_9AGAR|nr:hypothetical protein BD626DRAFT_537905 [Auriculariopsis ampla]